MEIFFLNKSPHRIAEMVCDLHVPKMLKESGLLLISSAKLMGCHTPEMGQSDWTDHQIAKWAAESHNNFMWLYTLHQELIRELQARFGIIDGVSVVLSNLLFDLPVIKAKFIEYGYDIERRVFPSRRVISIVNGTSIPPLCMPEFYKAYYQCLVNNLREEGEFENEHELLWDALSETTQLYYCIEKYTNSWCNYRYGGTVYWLDAKSNELSLWEDMKKQGWRSTKQQFRLPGSLKEMELVVQEVDPTKNMNFA